MAILAGIGAAFAWAVAVHSYARTTGLLAPRVALAWVMLVGAAITVPVILLFGLPSNLTPAAVGWLAVVGVGNVVGLLLQLRAFRILPTGIVATIASTEGAIAAVFAVLAGEPLSLALAVALTVVAVGIVMTTVVPGEVEAFERPSNRTGFLLMAGAATLFGLGLFATGQVDDAVPVVWALVPARAIGVLAIALPLAINGRLARPGAAVPFVLLAGIAEVIGFASFAVGARDSVAIAAVLASQFATIALIAGRLFFGERLSRLQMAGVATVIVGVAAVVLVQA
jgi:drug/metabolite transporter (DMT)-like permease